MPDAATDDRPDLGGLRWARELNDAEPSLLFHALGAAANRQLRDGLAFCRANGLTLDTVEQEDLRLPAFAPAVAGLRRRLDDGPGLVVITGIDLDGLDDGESGIVAWTLGNYLGRPVRQGLSADRRLFTVADRGDANTDPTRIGASAQRSRLHSDNGCLEPRPPAYIGLLCVQPSRLGGDSEVIAADTLHDVIAAERPDLLPLYFERWHFLPPRLHTWPAGSPTIVKPILERVGGELHVHYARVMIEPGMSRAGTPLDARQREALDFLDSLLDRDDLLFRHRLARGEMLVTNNLRTLHGRGAFTDDGEARRCLKRVWMWRRHRGPGDDPAALDLSELDGQGAGATA